MPLSPIRSPSLFYRRAISSTIFLFLHARCEYSCRLYTSRTHLSNLIPVVSGKTAESLLPGLPLEAAGESSNGLNADFSDFFVGLADLAHHFRRRSRSILEKRPSLQRLHHSLLFSFCSESKSSHPSHKTLSILGRCAIRPRYWRMGWQRLHRELHLCPGSVVIRWTEAPGPLEKRHLRFPPSITFSLPNSTIFSIILWFCIFLQRGAHGPGQGWPSLRF